MTDRSRLFGYAWLAVLAAAAALRIAGLNSQLWLDEINPLLISVRRPLADILTDWPGLAAHTLMDALNHVAIAALGEKPWTLRLASALFGIAGVAAFARLCRRTFDREETLFLTALFALSYHHVFYSQNARAYSALIFFSIAAACVLPRLREPMGRTTSSAVLYVLSAALAAYSVPLGVFVLAGHAAALAAWKLADRAAGRPPRFDSRIAARWLLASVVLIAILHLPLLGGFAEFIRERRGMPGEGPTVGMGLLVEAWEGLCAALHGPAGVILGGAAGFAGLALLWRKDAFLCTLLVAPIAVQAAALSLLGTGVRPRFFAIALPVAFIVCGHMVHTAARFAISNRQLRVAVLIALAIASAVPLARYYRTPKQDFLGALRTLDEMASHGDVAAGAYLAGRVIRDYYRPSFPVADTAEELRALEAPGRRVWIVTTLERLLKLKDEELFRRLKDDYRVVARLPGTVGDGDMRIYVRDPAATGAPPRTAEAVPPAP